MVLLNAFGVETVEEVFSQFLVVAVVTEHMVQDGQDGMGDGDDGAFNRRTGQAVGTGSRTVNEKLNPFSGERTDGIFRAREMWQL